LSPRALTPRHVLRRLRQSIADWPGGHTDGTLAVLWSLAAWTFVIAALALAGVVVGHAVQVLDDDRAAVLLYANGFPLSVGGCALLLASCALLSYRPGNWQSERAWRRSTRPAARLALQPDPDVTRSDRAGGGLWLYLVLLASALLLGL
jgi:hypothetical protein